MLSVWIFFFLFFSNDVFYSSKKTFFKDFFFFLHFFFFFFFFFTKNVFFFLNTKTSIYWCRLRDLPLELRGLPRKAISLRLACLEEHEEWSEELMKTMIGILCCEEDSPQLFLRLISKVCVSNSFFFFFFCVCSVEDCLWTVRYFEVISLLRFNFEVAIKLESCIYLMQQEKLNPRKRLLIDCFYHLNNVFLTPIVQNNFFSWLSK